DAERGGGCGVGKLQSLSQESLDVAVLGDERRAMRVNDENCALWTVEVLQDDLDRGLIRRGSPSGRVLLPRDLRRYGQGANAEFEPELFGIVMEAVERAVRVMDGEQQRHDRMRERSRSHR